MGGSDDYINSVLQHLIGKKVAVYVPLGDLTQYFEKRNLRTKSGKKMDVVTGAGNGT